MSSFGDGNIKTRMQEDLDCIAWTYYGKNVSELTPEEKLQFVMRVMEVLEYITGYTFSDDDSHAYIQED
jgi:hypothetical protein